MSELDYTSDELLEHMTSHFYGGMSWETYGYGQGFWQMHHIEPLSTFDLEDAGEFRACWSLSNLKPLWFEDHVAVHAELRATA